jgi:hypothetical protein
VKLVFVFWVGRWLAGEAAAFIGRRRPVVE